MNPQELRIGNYINHYYNGNIKVDVDVLTALHSFTLVDMTKYQMTFFPIKITKKLLFKCGFKNEGIDDDWIIYRHKSIRICKTQRLGFIFNYDDGNDYIKITSLHQLQNLYFSLTNQELKINL